VRFSSWAVLRLKQSNPISLLALILTPMALPAMLETPRSFVRTGVEDPEVVAAQVWHSMTLLSREAIERQLHRMFRSRGGFHLPIDRTCVYVSCYVRRRTCAAIGPAATIVKGTVKGKSSSSE